MIKLLTKNRFFREGIGLVAIIGQVANAEPPDSYYDLANGLVGKPLKDALHDAVDNHLVIPYGTTDEVMRVIDRSWEDSSKVELIYSTFTMPATDLGAAGASVWNREHLWPRSFGIGSNGPDNSDLHNLFPCNAAVNASRGNKHFDETESGGQQNSVSSENTFDSDSWEPSDQDKGIVARAAMYVAVRYDGSDQSTEDVELSESPDPATSRMGKLSTLLRWHREFPPSASERARNDAIFMGVNTSAGFLKQGNRNPFIDYPALAEAVFLPPEVWTWSKWQVQSFRIDSLDNPASSGLLADPDQDGFVNLLEFVGASKPGQQDSQPLIKIETEGSNAVVRFRKIKNLSLSGFDCTWEISPDLKTWTMIDPVQSTELDEGRTTVEVLRLPISGKRTFCRLRVFYVGFD